jgi:dihydrodipicolinate synthase/N-acetylneuraminate lyase
MSLAGLAVPVPTLFGPDGALDPEKNARFGQELARTGVDHLFVLGSLGEFPLLTDDERSRLLSAVLGAPLGAADVWVGCGAPSTRQAVGYAVAAERAGASALVVVPPYYLHPPPAGIDRYYRALRAAVRLPLLAYNIPSLVGYALAPAQLHALYRDRVLVGTKDTAGSIASVAGFLRDAPEGFAVLPGDDALAAEAIRLGAVGAIMGVANFAPRVCAALVTAARSGDVARATELQGLVSALVEVTRTAPFPAVDKFLAARLRGAEVGYRSPYDALSAEEERAVLARLAPLEDRVRAFERT